MSLPVMHSMWMDDSDLAMGEFEPSLMTTAICPMSVFDKFGWDSDILGPDTDELLDKICIKTEPEDLLLSDDKAITDFGSLNSIFPDLIDETKSSLDLDSLKSILSPAEDDPLSSIFDDDFNVKETVDVTDVKEEDPIMMDNFALLSAPAPVVVPTVTSKPLPVPVNEIKIETPEEKEVIVSTGATATVACNSIIRIPVKRSPGSVNPNFSRPGTGRTVKAVVVCPDRSKSIVCNVVRSSNKSILIQKPVGRSLLNICNGQRSEQKLPIKVNVITSKDSAAFCKFKTTTTSASVMKCSSNGDVDPKPMVASVAATTTVSAAPNAVNVETLVNENVKIEYEEVRPETPQSLIGSDEEFYPFSSPNKSTESGFDDQENFMKSCLLDEDNLSSESYKCLPPAEVTGQIQPTIPDVFKYTPNSSPTNTNNDIQNNALDTFYTKINSTAGSTQNQFYSKAAANVDHDYGFTCRTPKASSIFCTDNLGIQTPSASEPPTDSDDDDINMLNDFNLNRDFESTELDREQKEYFENLKHQLKMAELVTKNREKEKSTKTTSGSSVKERKIAARNRKRKLSSKERNVSLDGGEKIKISIGHHKSDLKLSTGSPTTATGLLKVRLPVKESGHSSSSSCSSSSSGSPKRRKTSSGGRIFSPSERHLHNTNEQVRRIEMRQSFEELRRLIPKLYDKARAPKVSILQEAKSYCDELFQNDCKLQAQVTALKCQQERLKNTVSQLRRYAYASRH